MPSLCDRQHAYMGLATFIEEANTAGFAAEPPDVVLMEWRAYSYLTLVLEKTALPADRYRNWLQYDETPGLGDCAHALHVYNISRARAQAILAALEAIEPYPSKKPVEGYQIGIVLREAGITPVG